MTTLVQAPAKIIAERLQRSLGPNPVILCGSRATGEAHDDSDYDVLMLLPLRRIPFALGRMERTARELEAELGVRVTVNPLPAFRLRRPGRSLLVWKLRREGVVLSAPGTFVLQPDSSQPTEQMRASYALSGLRYLIADLRPEHLGLEVLPSELGRAVRKACLHAVQLQLLRSGRYASGLDEALSIVEPSRDMKIERLAETCDRPETWFGVRDLLIEEVNEEPIGWMPSLARNLQYATLSALRGRGHRLKALIGRRSIGQRLERAVVHLAASLCPGGTVDFVRVADAAASLPRFLRPDGKSDWTALRDTVEREWPDANPLLAM